MKALRIAASACLLSSALLAQEPTQVLFLGTSYTNNNSLPGLVESLAESEGRPMDVNMWAPGGHTLGGPGPNAHATDVISQGLITQTDWDVVVLQEQSDLPVIPAAFNVFSIPGGVALSDSIRANFLRTRTMLFMTWARRGGGQFCIQGSCSPVFSDFDGMQNAIATSYEFLADMISAEVAPVGIAWNEALMSDPSLVLHEADDSNPNERGSYLAACTFYAKIFDRSPVGMDFVSTLAPTEARFLQEIAAQTVFGPDTPQFDVVCNGDGGDAQGCTQCPCDNDAPAGTVGGCLNRAERSARLIASGSTSVELDDLRFEVFGAVPGTFAVLISGSQLAPANPQNPCFGTGSGLATASFDGLRCVATQVVRHGARPTDGLGSVGIANRGWGKPEGFPNNRFEAGETRYFQVIYREEAIRTCSTGQNTTQAVRVMYTP